MTAALLPTPVAAVVAPAGNAASGTPAQADAGEPGAFARELDRASGPPADEPAAEPAGPRPPAEPAPQDPAGSARHTARQRADWLQHQRLLDRRLALQRAPRDAGPDTEVQGAAGRGPAGAGDLDPAGDARARTDADAAAADATASLAVPTVAAAATDPGKPVLQAAPAPSGPAADPALAAGAAAAAASKPAGPAVASVDDAARASEAEAALGIERRAAGSRMPSSEPRTDAPREARPLGAPASNAAAARPGATTTGPTDAAPLRRPGEADTDKDTRTLQSFTAAAATAPAPPVELPVAPVAPAPAVAGSATPAAGAPAAPDSSAAPRELQITVPVDAPAFATRFGEEISVLARNGVQEARVHLHPAELGPITVQITMEGLGAQVHLAAAVAETRQALEQAMPSLAASLRETGLTLTGGGVFEQPRPRDQSAEASQPGTRGGRRDADADDDAPVLSAIGASVRPTRLRGMLDLYA